jgi:protein-S-isoprenylcysteine O-methyltransferase Ste14
MLLGQALIALLAFVAPPSGPRSAPAHARPLCLAARGARARAASPALSSSGGADKKAEGRPLQDARAEGGFLGSVRRGLRNLSDGEPGKRGEVYVGVQLAALVLVLFGDLPGLPLLRLLHLVLGPLCFFAGVVLALAAAYRLGESLSPWPIPVEGSALQTTGAYALVRHPMYVGLTLLAVGCSTLAQSVPRIIVSALLGLFLRAQAIVEETEMRKRHSDAWDAYADATPRFVPAAVARLPLEQIAQLWRGERCD